MLSTNAEVQAGRPYESYPDDPMHTRIYTLKNGLKAYLTVYKDKPRIQTYIAVKAGSKYDPKETTGLAHYLEHMMFKGTHNYGTLNWEKEKSFLDQLSQLFEAHKNAVGKEAKDAIYQQIDSVSHEASKWAIPSEYDKMLTSMGAKGTNAYTSNDQTVYVNDIPANEMEKWMALESNRFQTLVLRLFHTELETVYEEFNRSQDNDGRWSYQKVWTGLLPTHPYGTQTTIGLGEHLKNPSMVNIHNYFNTYYRPNNIAICMSGDFNPDSTIEMIDKYFGKWEPGTFPELHFDAPPKLTAPVTMETFGPQTEHVYLGFLFNGAGSEDEKYLDMISMLLNNGKAGLMDINLLQKQQVLEANAFSDTRNDYSAFMLYGKPREGQSLEEVRDLLLQQLEKIKKGEFSENLMKACVTDARYREMKSLENNSSRASKLVDAFIRNKPYDKYMHQIDEIAKLNKAQIVAFANQHFSNNYVVSYKRKGEDKERHKVDKPKITPVVINRDTSSDFLKHISTIPSKRLTPRFIDFNKDIKHDKLANGLVFDYIPNPVNRTFSLSYVYDMGSDNDREMALALSMIKYLGTDKFTTDSLSYELFRLGLSLDFSVARKSMRVSLSGVESSLKDGVSLMEHILHHVKADQAVYDTLVNDILKKRANDKLNKGTILFSGMADFARYGADNPFRNSLSEKELKAMNLQHLQDKLRTLESYPHKIFYYGQESQAKVKTLLEANHKVPANMIPYPPAKIFKELDNEQTKVYFYHFDMVQAEMIFMSKDELFNKDLNSYINVFNEYFGAGLSSIVFQEIREKKALAYSASCSFSAPAYKEESHYVSAYVGTQADKLKDAEPAMMALLKEMPQAERQFQNAREAAMIRMETDYITRAEIYSVYQIMKNRGLDHDARKEAYEKLKTLSLNDLNAFFQKHIKGKTYTIVLIGNRDKVDINFLKSLGEYKELSPEDVFNY